MKQWWLVVGAALFCLCAPERASAQDCASVCFSGAECLYSCQDGSGGSTTCGAYNGWNCQGSCSNICWGGAACESSCIGPSGWSTCGAGGQGNCVYCNTCDTSSSCSTQCYQGSTLTTCGGAGQSCTAEALASGACGATAATSTASSSTSSAILPADPADPAGKCRVVAPAVIATVAGKSLL